MKGSHKLIIKDNNTLSFLIGNWRLVLIGTWRLVITLFVLGLTDKVLALEGTDSSILIMSRALLFIIIAVISISEIENNKIKYRKEKEELPISKQIRRSK